MRKLRVPVYVIAGSYRRGKWWCNDIDLVMHRCYMADIDSKMKAIGWRVNIMRNQTATFSRQYVRIVGPRFFRKAIVIDVMPHDGYNVGNVLMFATGSAKHNGMIRLLLSQNGYSWANPAYIKQASDDKKQYFCTERDMYTFLKLPCLESKKRDGKTN